MKKQIYKKEIKWEEKPKYDSLLSGWFMFLSSIVIMLCVAKENPLVCGLTILFSAYGVFGIELIKRGEGKGKNIYYIKK